MHFIKDIVNEILISGLLIIICLYSIKIAKKYYYKSVKDIIRSKTKPKWLHYKIIKSFIRTSFYILPGIFLYLFLHYLDLIYNLTFIKILIKVTFLYLVFILFFLITCLINSIEIIYTTNISRANISIKSISDSAKVILWALFCIVSFGIITNSSLATIFTSIAGISAVLAFLFQDAIKNFISSIQIILSNLVKIGDWVEIPDNKIAGIIKHISFSSIQIENADSTITTLPTQMLISKILINSRNILELGNMVVRKTINVKADTINFISIIKFNELLTNNRISEFIKHKEYYEDLTNLELFQIYVYNYLKQEDYISKKTTLVRILDQKDNVLPIEIFTSIKTHKVVLFEELQSKILSHLIAISRCFDLQINQK